MNQRQSNTNIESISIFERNPKKTIFFVFIFILTASEVLLRVINPSIFYFCYQFYQVQSYSRDYEFDLEPDKIGHLLLKTSQNENGFNFLVTTNKYGFRTYDRELDNNFYKYDHDNNADFCERTKIIHAIGDSFTMGWGVDYNSSYPALLDWMLPEDYRIINLGLNGFGTIAATEKSMKLWDNFPADQVFYLFIPNDFHNDDDVIRIRKWNVCYHLFFEFIDLLKRNPYLANIPYAIKWYFYFDDLRNAKVEEKAKYIYKDNVKVELDNTDISKVRILNYSHPSFLQILKYSKFVENKNSKLTVLVLNLNNDDLLFYKFCQENNIDAYLLKPLDNMLLKFDGHFNYLGNYSLAKYIYQNIIQIDDLVKGF